MPRRYHVALGGAITLVACFGAYLIWVRMHATSNTNGKPKYNTPQGACTVYYGSQTGRAQSFAKKLASRLKFFAHAKQGAVNLEHCDFAAFSQEDALAIIVVSTTDQGAVPDGARNFVKWLKQLIRLGEHLDIYFCVYGLGSSEYDDFNQAAKEIRQLLLKLGARELLEAEYGDEMVDLHGHFTVWQSKLVSTLALHYNVQVPPEALEASASEPPITPDASWRQFVHLEIRMHSSLDEAINDDFTQEQKNPILIPTLDIICRQQMQCVDYKVVENINLTPDDPVPTHCLTLEAPQPYEPAETVYVLYANPPDAVDYFMQRLNIKESDLAKYITFVPRHVKSGERVEYAAPLPIPAKLETVLIYYLDLVSFPEYHVLYQLGSFLENSRECDVYRRLLKNTKLLNRLRNELHLTLVEFMQLFLPRARLVTSGFIQMITKKVARPYTISSRYTSEKPHLEVTVKLKTMALHSFKSLRKELHKRDVLYEDIPFTFFKRQRTYLGVCSSYLCNIDTGQVVKLYKRASAFSNIANTRLPIVSIANGAGIAPFRALWQGPQYSPSSQIYFGCRDPQHVLYSEELQQLKSKNKATVYICYSRAQQRIYVQELARSHKEEIAKVLETGAILCICGSKSMGAQTKAILNHVLPMSLEQLKVNGQFVEELW